ncbi:hypothetical protein [Shewanella sp. ALD9]|uniref:hypothetical protein n=1 Tax=Shewanella sp. ALD9 TaxID=2058330 RepID=UPI000C34839F|nr:hypothetical protein [Shewanella sp. ALD9]PKH33595.1 hypothetical protein CXF88_05750 [Shewanella sp. ALD9]
MRFKQLTQVIGIGRLNGTYSPRQLKVLVIISMMLIVSVLFFSGRENIFTISGQTESISLTFTSNQLNKWDISGASLLSDFNDFEPKHLTQQEVYFSPAQGASAIVSRKLNRSTEEIFIVISKYEGSVGEIETENGIEKLGSYIEISIPLVQARIFPFVGALSIGEDVAVGVDSILLSGTVKIIEQEFLSKGRYIAGEYNLDRGDRVELFMDDELQQASQVKGFMRLTKDNPIDITCHGVGEVVKVERLGSAGYAISPSVWARLAKDPFITAVTSLFATLLLLMEFTELIFNISSKKEE